MEDHLKFWKSQIIEIPDRICLMIKTSEMHHSICDLLIYLCNLIPVRDFSSIFSKIPDKSTSAVG